MNEFKNSKEKPLSYDSVKSILKYLNPTKREEIQINIPSYRKTNKLFPFNFVSVSLQTCCLTLDDWHWTVNEPNRDVEELDNEAIAVVRNQVNVEFWFEQTHLYSQETVYISTEEAMEKLLNNYLRNGSRIEQLILCNLPNCLKKRNPSNFKMCVQKLKLEWPAYKSFETIQPFIDNDRMEEIQFMVDAVSVKLLEEPLIKTSKELYITFPWENPVPLNNLLFNLQNHHLKMLHLNFSIDEIHRLALNWIESRKPIGTSFTLGLEDYMKLLDVFDNFKEHHGAIQSRIQELGISYFSHSVSLPIDKDSELVVFGGGRLYSFEWTLRMKVMKRGD